MFNKMNIHINQQISDIRKSLKNDNESKESIDNVISIIQTNYRKYKKYIFKYCIFTGIDNSGIIVGIDAWYESMSLPDLEIEDVCFLVQLNRKKAGDISRFLGKDIVKILN